MAASLDKRTKSRTKAIEVVVAFTDQIEKLDAESTSEYAKFVKYLLERGNLPSEATRVANLFHMPAEVAQKFLNMAEEVGLVRRMKARFSNEEFLYIPLYMSAVYRNLGLKRDIEKIIEEHDVFI